jgi:hypothetical protein
MNTGQMMLTALALILLGVTILTVNKNTIQHGTILRQTDVGVYAISLGTSYVEKATALNFDQYTVSSFISNNKTDSLTAISKLGPDLTHNGPYGCEKANADSTYDDFDDYNGYAKYDTVKGADVFTTSINVYYVDTTGTASSTKTFYKKMDVKTWGTVNRNVFEGSNIVGTDTIRFYYIFSYLYRI